MPAAFETAVRQHIGGEPKDFDHIVLRQTRRKTDEEKLSMQRRANRRVMAFGH